MDEFRTSTPVHFRFSRSARNPTLRTAETSLHEPLRLPSAFIVEHALERATFRRWLQPDRPLQGGRHSAVGIEQALVGRVPGIDTDEEGPVRLDVNWRLEPEVASGLPRRPPHTHRRCPAVLA